MKLGKFRVVDPKWYPSIETPQVIGRFGFMERLCIPESIKEDEEVFREVVVLEHKVAASGEVGYMQLKPHNERELRRKFPQAWQAFNGQEQEVQGIQLKELGFINDDEITFLHLNGIYVAEQLAGLSDARCQGLGFGWRRKRERAQGFIKEYLARSSRQDAIDREQGRDVPRVREPSRRPYEAAPRPKPKTKLKRKPKPRPAPPPAQEEAHAE